MGAFNTILAKLECPRCGSQVPAEVECKFGYTAGMAHYRIGDRYDWRPRVAFINGGRPENGTLDGEGYTDCPACGKDFFVKVLIQGDVIQAVEPDLSRQPYIADNQEMP